MGVSTFIDGADVTSYVLQGSVTHRLNRPAQATCRIPLAYSIGGAGSRLKVVDDTAGLIFHGMVMTVSDEGDEDMLYTEYMAMDPMELWQWRPARDGIEAGLANQGNFSLPTFMERNWPSPTTGPGIIKEILRQSEISPPTDQGEGPLFISYGQFEEGGVDMSGAPMDWPMTIAEVANMLTSTGEVDIVLKPIDSGGNMAEVSVHNGDYGTDRSGSVVFDYAMGNYNARRLRRVEDMTSVVNKLWYFLGPRIDDQHWKANVQGDDGGSSAPIPRTGGLPYPPGGENSPPNSATDNQIGVSRIASQGSYGVRMNIQIFDSRGDETDIGRDLYRRLWQMESWLRAQPRVLVHITPVRGTPLNFDIGDLVTVRAGAKVRGGFSGVQRVFEYTYTWDENGVTEIGELVTSANAEGI